MPAGRGYDHDDDVDDGNGDGNQHVSFGYLKHQSSAPKHPNIRTPNVRLQPSPPSRQPSAVCYVQTYRTSLVKRDGSMEEFPFTSPEFHPGIDIHSGKLTY